MRASRGYTLVELFVAAAVATVSLYASLNMATYAMRGNTELRDSQTAVSLAEHVLSTIQLEGWIWTTTEALNKTVYLTNLPLPPTVGQSSEWMLANTDQYIKDRRVGDLGNDQVWDPGVLQEIPSAQGRRYCVHYRLIWIAQDMARAEVRVTWARPHVPPDVLSTCPAALIDDVATVNTVALLAAVKRNTDVL